MPLLRARVRGQDDLLDGVRADLPDLRGLAVFPVAGHWLQQERPAEVSAALVEFLQSL